LIGVKYRLESSFDLKNWITNNGANGLIATSLQSSFSDTNPAPTKFFRAHVMP